MEDEIYTVAQTAQYLQLCEKTVRRLIKSQKLLASKVGDRSLRIRKVDIDNYLADNINGAKGAELK
ncbi:MAG: helix-turn-helix domain-containing protein [Kiritimatiellia bacterium]